MEWLAAALWVSLSANLALLGLFLCERARRRFWFAAACRLVEMARREADRLRAAAGDGPPAT